MTSPRTLRSVKSAAVALLSALALIVSLPVNAPGQLNLDWETEVGNYDLYNDAESHGILILSNTQLLIFGFAWGYYDTAPLVVVRISQSGYVLNTVHIAASSPVSRVVQPYPATLAFTQSGGASSSINLFDLMSMTRTWTLVVDGSQGAITNHPNGSLISAGRVYATDDMIVTSVDENGSIQWNYNPALAGVQYCRAVVAKESGTIVVPYDDQFQELVLAKLSPSGNLLEEFSFPAFTFPGNTLLPWYIYEQPSGNLLVAGNLPLEPDTSHTIGLFSNDGQLLQLAGGHDEEYHSVPMPDGGYLTWQDYDTDPYIEFWRYDAAFNQLWHDQYTFPSTADYGGIYAHVKIASDGSIIAGGTYWRMVYPYDVPIPAMFAAKFTEDPTDMQIDVESYGPDSLEVDAPGQFYWHGELTNNTDAPITTDVWVIVRTPAGYPSEPLRVWEDVTVPALGTFAADLSQPVPAGTGAGDYNYIVRAGEYDAADPAHTIQDYFPVTVTGDVAADMDPPRTRGVVTAPLPSPRQSR